MRPSWEETFMSIAETVSKRSTCLRRKVGAVLVKDKHIIATGYNGAPSGLPHCEETGCLREQLNIPSGEQHELCLAGDTVIKLLNGTYKTIKELAEEGKDVWVYSIDTKTGKIVPALAINPRLTGFRDDLVRITLDNGASIVCTKDHKFLLRDCTYKKAEALQYGDSLMPMYYNFAWNRGYESISNTIQATREKWKPGWNCNTHMTPTHHLVYKYFNGALEKGFVVHHIDENILNNEPGNLCKKSFGEHSKYHLKDRPRYLFKEMARKGIMTQKQMLRNDPDFLKRKQEIGSRNMKNNWSNPAFREKMKAININNGKITALKTNSDPVAIEKRKIGRILKGISYLLFQTNGLVTPENYDAIREKYKVSLRSGDTGSVPPRKETILKYFNSIEEAIKAAKTYNHKVVSVERLKCGKIPVYDLTVPQYHNFAIDLGDNSCVFVHNCRSVHAEQNVIIQAALHGSNPQGAELYVTCSPCSICAKMLVNAGIKKIVYQGEYPDWMALEILKDGGVVLENYPSRQNGSR